MIKSRVLLITAAMQILIFCWFVPACFAQVPAPEQEQSYHFDPHGKPDPFKPFIREPKKEGKVQRDKLEPLERFNLDQLTLIGIGQSEDRFMAVVTDPKGKSYILIEGTRIGPNRGRVAKILSDQVIIEEQISGDSGKKYLRRVPLLLHKEEREEKP